MGSRIEIDYIPTVVERGESSLYVIGHLFAIATVEKRYARWLTPHSTDGKDSNKNLFLPNKG